jgi:hypothetical protein
MPFLKRQPQFTCFERDNRGHIFDRPFHGFHRAVCSVTHLVLVPAPRAGWDASRIRGTRKPFVPVRRPFSHDGSPAEAGFQTLGG